MSGANVLRQKHAEPRLLLIYSMCFFWLKSLLIYSQRNSGASTSINLLQKFFFKLIHVLLLTANLMQFVLSD